MDYIQWFEDNKEFLQNQILEKITEFFNNPTATNRHGLENCLRQYYASSLPVADRRYEIEQDRMRAELGIQRRK